MPPFSSPSESICPYICPHWQEGPHLVTQQHDNHVLLGILVDLSQPCLEMERKHRNGDRIQDTKYGEVAGMYKNTPHFRDNTENVLRTRLFNAKPRTITILKPTENRFQTQNEKDNRLIQLL